MTTQKERIQTPLAKARGLGSAKEGVSHWIKQRVSAIAALILVPWAVFSIAGLPLTDYDAVRTWLETPVNAVLMILLVAVIFKHAILGLEVIIEDYIANKGFKIFKLISMKFFYTTLAVISLFSILKVAL